MGKKKEFRKRIEKILKRLDEKPVWLQRRYYPDASISLEDYHKTKTSTQCQCHLEKSERWEWGWNENVQRYDWRLETHWGPRVEENQQEGGWGGVMDDDGWNFNSWYR